MTRLVSACYNDFYPFSGLLEISNRLVAEGPDDLRRGDILILWGGEDISPTIYGKRRSYYSGAKRGSLSNRDNIEMNLVCAAKDLEIPIIGVCRGAQLLCGLNNGYLFQHVTNHAVVREHMVYTEDGKNFFANSLHHQQMVPGGNFELIAWTKAISAVYFDVDIDVKQHPLGVDPEFVYYPDCRGFAIQWHPEMMKSNCEATLYIGEKIKEKLKDYLE